MIIEYEGQQYPFDFDDVGVLQGIAIERHVGISFAEWAAIIEKGATLITLQALGWLILEGGDLSKPIAETNFKMGRLGTALTNALARAQADEAVRQESLPGPTSGAGPGAPEANGAAAAAPGPLSPLSSALT